MPKSIEQLKKEIKIAEKDKERKKLEDKLKALKSSGKGKTFQKKAFSALDRASRNFGF